MLTVGQPLLKTDYSARLIEVESLVKLVDKNGDVVVKKLDREKK